jgi:hypothetical protein
MIAVTLIVIAAAASAAWQLAPVRARYDAMRALADALPDRGFSGRMRHGIMLPLVRRAARGLGGGCSGCAAAAAQAGARARGHAHPSH